MGVSLFKIPVDPSQQQTFPIAKTACFTFSWREKYLHEQHQLLKMLLFLLHPEPQCQGFTREDFLIGQHYHHKMLYFLPHPEPQCQGFSSEDFISSQLYHSHSHTEGSKNPPTLPSFKNQDAIAHLWLFTLHGTVHFKFFPAPKHVFLCDVQNEWGMLLYLKLTVCGRSTPTPLQTSHAKTWNWCSVAPDNKIPVCQLQTLPLRITYLTPALCRWDIFMTQGQCRNSLWLDQRRLIQFNFTPGLSLSEINLLKSGSANAGFQSNSTTKIYSSLHIQSSSLLGKAGLALDKQQCSTTPISLEERSSVSSHHWLQKALVKLLYVKQNTSCVTFKINWFSLRNQYFIRQRHLQLWRLFIKKYLVVKKRQDLRDKQLEAIKKALERTLTRTY